MSAFGKLLAGCCSPKDTTAAIDQANGAKEDSFYSEALTSDLSGKKKALFVGINYKGSNAELRGCHNDVANLYKFVTEVWGFHPSNTLVLLDDGSDPRRMPTRRTIEAAARWLVTGAASGDSLFFHYSGHGGSQSDTSGDEKDAKDETILPVDFETAGQITDDDLQRMLVAPLPKGVRLTTIFDSCHSGTVLDLPYQYSAGGEKIELRVADYKKDMLSALLSGAASNGSIPPAFANLLSQGINVSALKSPAVGPSSEEKASRADADVILFSGCRDDQTSADAQIAGAATGAMSYAFIKSMKGANNRITYTDLIQSIRTILQGQYSQVPQMSSGRPVELDVQFAM